MTRYSAPTETVFVGDRADAIRFQRCELQVTEGPDKGSQVSLGQRTIRIGTAPENDLVLTDRAVSRRHAEITAAEDGFVLRDLASKNGTFVGAAKVAEVTLVKGTSVKLGNTTIQFRFGEGDSIEFKLEDDEKFGDAIGTTVAMRELFTVLTRAASTDLTVLLEGETGTGKELLADGIHENSKRTGKPMLVVDCGSIPRELIEAELYGAMKGAYTGATQDRAGIFEMADGGTVFLDEIGELPMDMQPQLLRVLERGEVRRLGASETKNVDVRIVAATNRDLLQEVAAGRFRQDLYYRLSVVRVRVPPLRERRGDIPVIAKAMAKEIAEDFPDAVESGASQHVAAIVARYKDYPWPGNVRELRNVIERALVLASVEGAGPPSAVAPEGSPTAGEPAPMGAPPTTFKVAKHEAISAFEQDYLSSVMNATGHNVSKAARLAGLDRRNFQKLLRKYGFKPQKPGDS